MTYNLTSKFAAGVFFISSVSMLWATSQSDELIETAFKKSYIYKTYLKDDAITVKATDAAVILTGTVADNSHKYWAANTVGSLPTVMSVDNQLTIKGEPPFAEHSDGWIGMKVKNTLYFNRNVSATKTSVDVKDGVVTLKGEATSLAQKDLTAEYAKDVEGVKGVINEMSVSSTPVPQGIFESIDDASISAQVKWSLASHLSTSKINPNVSTVAGVVTLSGPVKTSTEKDLVTKLVANVQGVKSVSDNLTVTELTSANP
jgi:hyperosmotically inducible protein